MQKFCFVSECVRLCVLSSVCEYFVSLLIVQKMSWIFINRLWQKYTFICMYKKEHFLSNGFIGGGFFFIFFLHVSCLYDGVVDVVFVIVVAVHSFWYFLHHKKNKESTTTYAVIRCVRYIVYEFIWWVMSRKKYTYKKSFWFYKVLVFRNVY